MPRDSNGVYTKPANTTAVTGTLISSSAYNTLADDEANALTDSLSRSGKGAMQADLNMSAKKVTGLATATQASDAVRFDQLTSVVQANTNFAGTTTGTAAAYQGVTTPAITAYLTGRVYSFIPHVDSAANPTLSINSKGPKAIRLIGNGLLAAGTLQAGTAYLIEDMGSTFQILSILSIPGTAAARDVGTAAGNLTEVVDGSGNLNSALNVANKNLSNLSLDGISRTTWASVAFAGSTGSAIAAFGASSARNSIGLYTVNFPALVGEYEVRIGMDLAITTAATQASVVAGTRTSTSVQISATSGNSSLSPFDPSRVTVAINRIA